VDKASALCRAVVAWTGYGKTPSPRRDEQHLAAELGAHEATSLLPQVRALEDDFYASDARDTASSLADMGQRASIDFRRLHPEVDELVVEAFAWCYTFDYK
jgi:hypothetical protein